MDRVVEDWTSVSLVNLVPQSVGVGMTSTLRPASASITQAVAIAARGSAGTGIAVPLPSADRSSPPPCRPITSTLQLKQVAPGSSTTVLLQSRPLKREPDSSPQPGGSSVFDSRPAGGGKLTVPARRLTSTGDKLLLPDSPDRQTCSSTTQVSGYAEVKEECPRRFCLVCGDTASGFHYGVSSCEACKAFFKRTIQGNIEYTCPATGDCEINKRRRKACQACRFQKCLRKGMLKEGVRLDRVRGGRQKYRRVTESTQFGEVLSGRKISLEDNQLLEALTACEPDPLTTPGGVDPALPPSLELVSQLADLYDRELVGTIGWAKQIPGFAELSLNDQMKLLQASWTEVLSLSLAYRSLPRLGRLNFAADFSLSESQAATCGLSHFYQKCMQIVERLERLGITREEYLILKSLVLSNSDCQLEEISLVQRLRETIMAALYDCVCVVRCGDSAVQVQSLLLVLPALRETNTALRQFWNNVHKEGTIPLHKLLLEMLET